MKTAREVFSKHTTTTFRIQDHLLVGTVIYFLVLFPAHTHYTVVRIPLFLPFQAHKIEKTSPPTERGSNAVGNMAPHPVHVFPVIHHHSRDVLYQTTPFCLSHVVILQLIYVTPYHSDQ